jgi:hypothetical protein
MNDGGPAFPFMTPDPHGPVDTDGCLGYPGMSLRDWFAGMALMGVLNNAESRIAPQEQFDAEQTNATLLAANCYFMADAMLHQREEAGT